MHICALIISDCNGKKLSKSVNRNQPQILESGTVIGNTVLLNIVEKSLLHFPM